MTLTLHLNPELDAGLVAKAEARGMDVEQYVQSLVEQEVFPMPRSGSIPAGRSEAVRRMLEFSDKYRLSFGEPITRQAMHESHRF